MTIYILRHEERFDDPKFFTSLTHRGYENSFLLINKINKLNIDIIYCSPFLRCIQTIKPYCEKNNIKINIENSLYEKIHTEVFNKNNYKHSHTELYKHHFDLKKIINQDYKSFLKLNDLIFPENTFDNIYKRTIPFINKIKNNTENILLISHLSTICVIKDYLLFDKISSDEEDLNMGHLEQII
jgi:broad specificity phosphatase PhoE